MQEKGTNHGDMLSYLVIHLAVMYGMVCIAKEIYSRPSLFSIPAEVCPFITPQGYLPRFLIGWSPRDGYTSIRFA